MEDPAAQLDWRRHKRVYLNSQSHAGVVALDDLNPGPEPGLNRGAVGFASASKGAGSRTRWVCPFRRKTKMKPEPRRRNEHRRED